MSIYDYFRKVVANYDVNWSIDGLKNARAQEIDF